MVQKEILFSELKTADLYVDALYKAGISGNVSDDPISKLMLCENQGGFRIVGKRPIQHTNSQCFIQHWMTLTGRTE